MGSIVKTIPGVQPVSDAEMLNSPWVSDMGFDSMPDEERNRIVKAALRAERPDSWTAPMQGAYNPYPSFDPEVSQEMSSDPEAQAIIDELGETKDVKDLPFWEKGKSNFTWDKQLDQRNAEKWKRLWEGVTGIALQKKEGMDIVDRQKAGLGRKYAGQKDQNTFFGMQLGEPNQAWPASAGGRHLPFWQRTPIEGEGNWNKIPYTEPFDILTRGGKSMMLADDKSPKNGSKKDQKGGSKGVDSDLKLDKIDSDRYDKLREALVAYAKSPTNLDISPMVALTDSLTGSNLMSAYEVPLTEEEKGLKVAQIGNEIDQQEAKDIYKKNYLDIERKRIRAKAELEQTKLATQIRLKQMELEGKALKGNMKDAKTLYKDNKGSFNEIGKMYTPFQVPGDTDGKTFYPRSKNNAQIIAGEVHRLSKESGKSPNYIIKDMMMDVLNPANPGARYADEIGMVVQKVED